MTCGIAWPCPPGRRACRGGGHSLRSRWPRGSHWGRVPLLRGLVLAASPITPESAIRGAGRAGLKQDQCIGFEMLWIGIYRDIGSVIHDIVRHGSVELESIPVKYCEWFKSVILDIYTTTTLETAFIQEVYDSPAEPSRQGSWLQVWPTGDEDNVAMNVDVTCDPVPRRQTIGKFSIYLIVFVVLTLQLTVQASDQALPTDKTTTVKVVVSVPRDNDPPRFERSLYNVDIPESQTVGSTIAEIKASDANRQVRENIWIVIIIYWYFRCDYNFGLFIW